MIQGSPEWHEDRLKGVGASEVPSIVGLCPYGGTPHKVWLVKTRRSKGFEGNSFTQHGQETEAAARARYEFIHMSDMAPACATHPIYSVCKASLDGISGDGKLILELKCPKGQSTFDMAKAGKVPDHYMAQVQFQLAVSGADMAHFFVYHEESGDDALVEVRPDVEYQGKLIAAVLEFWKFVETDTPPPLTEDDVKLIESDVEIEKICNEIIARSTKPETKVDGIFPIKKGKDKSLDALKAKAVELAGHPKMKCGRVQVSTVLRKGVFSYHKLTIGEGA